MAGTTRPPLTAGPAPPPVAVARRRPPPPALRQLHAVAAIAERDVVKLLRDRPRLAVNLAFPVLLIIGLSNILAPTVGKVTGLSTVTLSA